MQKIKNRALFILFLRSFFSQVLWNFERMQNVGFLCLIAPFLDKIYIDKQKRINAYKRHLEFFNTHPYFIAPLVSITVALEQELAGGKHGASEERISAIKTNMAGPLAAIGDSLFWASWRPLTAFAAVLLVLFNLHLYIWPLIIPIFFLVLYNLPHLTLRWNGIIQGYKRKTEVIALIEKINFKRMIFLIRMVGILILAIAAIGFLFTYGDRLFLYLGYFVFAIVLLKRGLSSVIIFYGTIVTSIIFSIVGFF